MELAIAEPIKNKQPKSTYRLKTVGMMGDADGYNHEYFDFPDTTKGIEECKNVIRLLHSVFELDHNTACSQNSVRKVLEERGAELGIKYPTDIYSGAVGYDITCQGEWAFLESIELTHFDEIGTERVVLINSEKSLYRKNFSGDERLE